MAASNWLFIPNVLRVFLRMSCLCVTSALFTWRVVAIVFFFRKKGGDSNQADFLAQRMEQYESTLGDIYQ